MKIATYNVNGVNGRLPRLLEWLQETRPDVACLQELKTDDTKFPARALADAGYGAIWHGQRAHHGSAILARGKPPREVRRGLPGDSADTEARYLEGEVIFRDFERLKLASDPKKLKRTLDEKSKLLDQAKQIYVDVVTFGDREWATAALYRIGDAYERFSKALRDAPVPKELNAEEQQVYRDELEKVVVVVEEKAIDAYKGGYQKALQLGVYN